MYAMSIHPPLTFKDRALLVLHLGDAVHELLRTRHVLHRAAAPVAVLPTRVVGVDILLGLLQLALAAATLRCGKWGRPHGRRIFSHASLSVSGGACYL